MEATTTKFAREVAGNLRAEMGRRGLTIGDLATALGCSRHTAASRFYGTKAMSVGELEMVANWLVLDWTDLLGERQSEAA